MQLYKQCDRSCDKNNDGDGDDADDGDDSDDGDDEYSCVLGGLCLQDKGGRGSNSERLKLHCAHMAGRDPNIHHEKKNLDEYKDASFWCVSHATDRWIGGWMRTNSPWRAQQIHPWIVPRSKITPENKRGALWSSHVTAPDSWALAAIT